MTKIRNKIELISIDAVKPYKDNAKVHKKKDIELLAEHIKESGWDQPIVIVAETGEIIKGHKRYAAARKLKLKQVPVIKLSGLSEIEIEERRLADNKLAESKWDNQKLKASLTRLMSANCNVSRLGFGDLPSKIRKTPEKPEVEFTEVLGESNNYIVLVFDNEIDWLNAQTHFELKQKKAYQVKENKKAQCIGIGRVVDGGKYLNKINGK